MSLNRLLILIFSKDRPMQLELTIRSLYKHLKSISTIPVSTYVLYKATLPEYQKGYMEIENKEALHFIRERNFYEDVLRITSNIYFSHIMFVVDDTVFIKDFNIDTGINLLNENRSILGLSLRLGNNTNFCYMSNQNQCMKKPIERKGEFNIWAWKDSSGDFGYPLELSSSIYRTSDIIDILYRVEKFVNPNVMELFMDEHRKSNQVCSKVSQRPYLASFETSIAFSNPLNITQDMWQNKHQQNSHNSLIKLNQKFLQGYRIVLEPFETLTPNSAHYEHEIILSNK